MTEQSPWPAGGGEMGARVRAHDWAATPLGPIADWPAELKLATALVLESGFPTALVWGPDLVTIYNDGFRPILGGKPEALGRSFAEIWSEAWDEVRPVVERAFAGKSTFNKDYPVEVERSGRPEQAYFSFSYSPVRMLDGSVAGMIAMIVETTERVMTESRIDVTEERQAFLLKLSDALRPLSDPLEIKATVCRIVGEHMNAARSYYVELDMAREAYVVERDYHRPGDAGLAGIFPYSDYGQPLEIFKNGVPLRVENVATAPEMAGISPPYECLGIKSFLSVPLFKDGNLVAALAATAARPRLWTDEEVSLLVAVAERTWEAVERARAEGALQASERRMRSLATGIPQLVFQSKSDGCRIWVSPQWIEFTGLGLEESVGHGWLDAIHPDERSATLAGWEGVEERGLYYIEHRILHAASSEHRWHQTRATPLRDEDGQIVEWLGTSTDVDELRALQRRQELLVAELQHRVRNLLAMIRSIGQRTAATAESVDDYAQHLEGRISALARTQALLTREIGRGVDLQNLVLDELEAQAALPGRYSVKGEDVSLPPKAAEVLTLAVHELATNAVKYGALTQAGGRIEIGWMIEDSDEGRPRWLCFTWTESGVTMEGGPRREGFGTELITARVPYELKGEGRMDFRETGVEATIRFPLVSGASVLQTDAGPGSSAR
ncbi:MAG: HWE histidine kinase domain-containing protein [Allosphingosinicella sp.]|uniref:PAS domain-containing sensor histidine kinase n=1 Tax=Allosphingosinicella sp. TaxID=2823234 RepID=UPI003960B850